MSDRHVKYLLVGGGLAAFSAAAAIRQIDGQGPLLFVGQEISRPYYRTPLSKGFLRRRLPRAELFTCDPDWFSTHGVQLRTGCRAAHLDAARAIVTLDSGESVSYDRLLLATGAVPRPLVLPGHHLPNVFPFRSIEDVEQLHKAIDKAKAEGHRHAGGRGTAAVIGGGLLGVEIAASLSECGIGVSLIAGAAYPWSKIAGETTGKFLSLLLTRRGVSVHEPRAQRIEGDGRAQRVILADGAVVPADFVVSAIGSVPNKELLRGTGILAEKAILADEHCRTNVQDIYAAGDCAAVRDPIFGKHRTPDQWDTAAATGTIAGVNMAGGDAVLSAVASFTSEFFGIWAHAWGQSKHLARRLLRGTPNLDAPSFLEIGIAGDGRISQILAIGNPGEEKTLEELVRRRIPVNGNDEALKDPAMPLNSLL